MSVDIVGDEFGSNQNVLDVAKADPIQNGDNLLVYIDILVKSVRSMIQ